MTERDMEERFAHVGQCTSRVRASGQVHESGAGVWDVMEGGPLL